MGGISVLGCLSYFRGLPIPATIQQLTGHESGRWQGDLPGRYFANALSSGYIVKNDDGTYAPSRKALEKGLPEIAENLEEAEKKVADLRSYFHSLKEFEKSMAS